MRDPISSHPPPQPSGPPADPETAAAIGRVRRLMLVALTLTFGAVAAVVALVGYRVFALGGSAPPPDAGVSLPAGAKVLQTAVAEGRLVVTLDLGGTTEIRTYDLRTFKPLGRLTFSPAP